jgi:hypothetical protein
MEQEQNKNEEQSHVSGVSATEIASDAVPFNDNQDIRDKYFEPERNKQHTLFSGTDNNQENDLRQKENKQKSDSLRPLL